MCVRFRERDRERECVCERQRVRERDEKREMRRRVWEENLSRTLSLMKLQSYKTLCSASLGMYMCI